MQQNANAASPASTNAWSAAYPPSDHDRLILDWRAGRVAADTVLARLRHWQAVTTDVARRSRIASDRISVAWQVGQPNEAVVAAQDVGVAALTAYALGPLAAAARAARNLPLQGQAVQRRIALEPQAFDARVQEALWLIDSGSHDAAQRAVDALNARATNTSERVAVLELRAVSAETRNDLPGARRHYDDLLRLDPGYRPAQRSRIFLASRMGTPNTALAEARAVPGLLSPLEMASLEQEALGERLRWAIAERDRGGDDLQRFSALDAVLRDGDALARRLTATDPTLDQPEWRAVQRRLDADRVVALFQRGGRDADVVALYESLRATGPAPWYATASAAGAQARLRRADLAVPLYQTALRDGGDAVRMPSDVHVGLVYAYLDTAQFEAADVLLADMISRTPPLLANSPEAGRPNDEYGDLLGLRALVLMYTDRPAQAQSQFNELTALAPRSEPYRTGQARLLRLREQPDAALRTFDDVLADHPLSVDARAGRAETLYDAGRMHEATQRLNELAQLHPGHGAVRSAQRTRDTVMAPRLSVEAVRGRDGGTLSNRDWRAEARLSSGWYTRANEHNWRVFARQLWSSADIGGTSLDAPRTGLGLQWRSGRFDGEAELHHTRDDVGPVASPPRTGGLALSAGWRATDHWRLSAALDTNSHDIPWRARQAGVAGRDASLGVGYVVNESRRLDARIARMSLSDGNDRNGASLAWRERWLSGPRWQLSTTLAADTARYAQQNVPYFSPSREDTLSLTGRAQWLTWKRDDRVMNQVLEAGVGRYRQAGFGSGATNMVRYAHEWNWGAGWQVRYGLGTSLHPYDGVGERRREIFIGFSMPFL